MWEDDPALSATLQEYYPVEDTPVSKNHANSEIPFLGTSSGKFDYAWVAGWVASLGSCPGGLLGTNLPWWTVLC